MRLFHPVYIVALAGACLAGGVRAAEPTEPVEEITVTGDQNALHLELAIDTAETEFYNLFNALVDEEFRISCREEHVLGSRIKKRICQTGYQREQLTKSAAWESMGMSYLASSGLVTKNRELSAKARELIETNEQLRQAASRLSDLVEQYQDRYLSPE